MLGVACPPATVLFQCSGACGGRYGTYKLVQKMPGGEGLVGFTRILHRTRPDLLMDEARPAANVAWATNARSRRSPRGPGHIPNVFGSLRHLGVGAHYQIKKLQVCLLSAVSEARPQPRQACFTDQSGMPKHCQVLVSASLVWR